MTKETVAQAAYRFLNSIGNPVELSRLVFFVFVCIDEIRHILRSMHSLNLTKTNVNLNKKNKTPNLWSVSDETKGICTRRFILPLIL